MRSQDSAKIPLALGIVFSPLLGIIFDPRTDTDGCYLCSLPSRNTYHLAIKEVAGAIGSGFRERSDTLDNRASLSLESFIKNDEIRWQIAPGDIE